MSESPDEQAFEAEAVAHVSVATKFEGRRIKNAEGRGGGSSEGRIALLGFAQEVVHDASVGA
jgi:hypothetical protein